MSVSYVLCLLNDNVFPLKGRVCEHVFRYWVTRECEVISGYVPVELLPGDLYYRHGGGASAQSVIDNAWDHCGLLFMAYVTFLEVGNRQFAN